MAGKKPIQAVLFDLGETLIVFGKFNTAGLLFRAARLTYRYLIDNNQPAGPFWLYTIRSFINLYGRLLFCKIRNADFDAMRLFRRYGRKKNFTLDEQQWEQFSWLWYLPLRTLGTTEPDLPATLQKLRGSGIKLGIVSNTFVPLAALQRHLCEEKLTDLFDLTFYSYQFKHRKPDKNIFLAAAQKLDIPPENILFVGDKISIDIRGALRSGMRPVLKDAYTNTNKKCPAGVLRISRISELPPLIEKINAINT